MSAAALLADFAAAGIRVSRHGDRLRVRAAPGIALDPYLGRIKEAKPALLAELLKAEIMAALAVEPEDFDRPAYDALVTRYDALALRERTAA